jgi:hypothetical protein
MSVFYGAREPLDLPGSVIATGPFGDIKNYDGRNFYLSWYPVGLITEGQALTPPAVAPLSREQRDSVARQTIDNLSAVIPAVATLRAQIETLRVEGGWVYALGGGSLADASATLHRRDRIGLYASEGYIPVDTGKYSSAPELANAVISSLFR